MEKILHKVNIIGGATVAVLSTMLGEFWYLFCAFLVLNVVDYITGILKAKYFNAENSCKGLKGIIKKTGYWVCIAIAFFVAICFGNMGEVLGIDLKFTHLFGWFTLATFIINEIRSILENLVQMGVEVPAFLVKGLEVAKSATEKRSDEDDNL